MVAPLVRDRDTEAYGLTMWVLGQRDVVNIDINRSVQRYMQKFGIREDRFEWLRRRYTEVLGDLKDGGVEVEKCKDCPPVAA